MGVNLTGTFTCAREAIKSMDAGGVILNLGSINSFLPFAPRHAYGGVQGGYEHSDPVHGSRTRAGRHLNGHPGSWLHPYA
ncbi:MULTISPECIES: hypothetical protein [unclassified Mesorhizobium]|uniref:hypothetical protein n=1 Tax=unclassified Mesorhizobium TaxID=325217 RepID=UPI0024797033|nr:MULTISPECIES: hypothetical protein [unclassified Mesorhizobium]